MTARIALGEIPVGEGRALTVDGSQVAVFRLRDGTVRAVSAVCPHLGGPLADGLVDAQVVICPLHTRSFDLRTGCEVGGDLAVEVWDVRLEADDTVVISPSIQDAVSA